MVLENDVLDVAYLVPRESVVERDLDGLEPNLRLHVVALHVNVHRLVAVEAPKKNR
jgi:hypothetical protein